MSQEQSILSSTNPGERGEAGFTLIELLIAMTLLALIVAALFGGLRLGARAWEAGAQRNSDLARLEVVQGLLRRQLSRAYYRIALTGSERGRRIAFEGDPAAVRFVAPAPAQIGLGGLYLMNLAVAEDEGNKRLVLTWQLSGAEEERLTESPGVETRVLIDRIAAIELSYFGPPDRRDEPRWFDRWDDAARLPSLVRIRIEFPAGDRRYWPELIVAPMLRRDTPRT